jgi:CspA family cold shock protein
MIAGTVKFYNSQRGFGFVQPDDGSKDVFVHATALERAGMSDLAEGQKVEFDTEVDSRSGKTAVATIRAASSLKDNARLDEIRAAPSGAAC